MFKVLSIIALLVSFSLAEEICNTDNLPMIPANSRQFLCAGRLCVRLGF